MINKRPPLFGGYNRDPNTQALQKQGFINQGSTLNPKPQIVVGWQHATALRYRSIKAQSFALGLFAHELARKTRKRESCVQRPASGKLMPAKK